LKRATPADLKRKSLKVQRKMCQITCQKLKS